MAGRISDRILYEKSDILLRLARLPSVGRVIISPDVLILVKNKPENRSWYRIIAEVKYKEATHNGITYIKLDPFEIINLGRRLNSDIYEDAEEDD